MGIPYLPVTGMDSISTHIMAVSLHFCMRDGNALRADCPRQTHLAPDSGTARDIARIRIVREKKTFCSKQSLTESSYQWEYGSKNFVAGMIIYATVVWSLKFNSTWHAVFEASFMLKPALMPQHI